MLTDPETGEQFPVNYQDLIGFTLGSLYDPFSFPFLAEVLALLEASAPPLTIGQAFNRLVGSNGLVNKRGFPHYPNFVEAFPAVACEDSNNPTDYARLVAAGRARRRQLRVLRPELDLGVEPVRAVAVHRR